MNIPGLVALNTGGDAAVTSISCASPGNCAAVGDYENGTAKISQPFVASETNGAWGQAREVPGIGNLGSGGTAETAAKIASVSCGSPGDCAAGGYYEDPAGYSHAYVVSETAGTWGDAITVQGSIIVASGVDSNITSVSCASAGNCSAVGYYTEGAVSTRVVDPFAVSETDGTWGTAQPITGLSSLNPFYTVPASVSCASAGNCSAGGMADTSSQRLAWVVSETDGSWGTAEEVPGVAGLSVTPNSRTTSVSCSAAGDCSATGWYLGTPAAVAFIANETNGTWGAAQPVPAPNAGQGMVPVSLSCVSPGNCSVSGNYYDTSNSSYQAFVADEVQGTVGAAEEIPGTAALNVGGFATAPSVSCAPSGYCATGGGYAGAGQSSEHAYVATESGGTWGMAQEISGLQTPESNASAGLASVSCTATGYCSAGGSYLDPAGKYQAFVVGEATAATVTLTVSAPTVTYGSEPAETFTATVSSAVGGTPTGTVAVTGPAGYAGGSGGTLCTITLDGGTGSCSFTPSPQFPGGTFTVTGSYSGDATYVAVSGTASVTVAKASTVTGLALAKTVITYGSETVETMTVSVSHVGSASPTGTVEVKSGALIVCTITLANGAGSCTLTASQLVPLTYQLVAVYSGDGNYLPSASAPVSLTVAAPPAVAVGAEGGDGALWVQAPQLGGGWHSLGGQIIAPPAIAAAPNPYGTTPAQPLFIATAGNNQLYIRSLTAGWQLLGPHTGSCLGAPAAVIAGGTLTVACRGLDNALWENTAAVPSSGLPQFTSGWTRLGGVLTAGPAAAPVGGTMTFFVPSTGGRVYTRTLASGYVATPWACIGNPAAAAEAASSDTIFACQGTNHTLYEAVNGGAGWTGGASLGGALIGGPGIAATSRVPEFLAESTNHGVWERTLLTGWASLGGGVAGGVGAAALN